MNSKDLKNCTTEELSTLEFELTKRDNPVAARFIRSFKKFYGKNVVVNRGRKVPRGTVGNVFWMGQTDYSKYGDKWGISTSIRVGIKDESENVYWTALNNVDLCEIS